MFGKTFDPFPYGTALGLLGVGVFAMSLVSLGADNVGYARAEWTARLAMVHAAPAIVLFVLQPAPRGNWWRAYWTAGLLAYLLHFWWAVVVVYQLDVGAIIQRQGWVTATNALVTILWIADVVIAWLPRAQTDLWVQILRFVNWALVTVSFVAASAVFRDDLLPRALGIALGAAVLAALLLRKPAAKPVA